MKCMMDTGLYQYSKMKEDGNYCQPRCVRAATIIRPLLVLNYGYFEPHQADGNETLKVRFFYIDRPGFNLILVGKFVVLSNS